jgi:alpha-mannosidase
MEPVRVNAPVKIDNDQVFISIVKTSADGKSMIIRLRSVSDKAETVNLSFPGIKPKSIRGCIADELPGDEMGSDLLPFGFSCCRLELCRL